MKTVIYGICGRMGSCLLDYLKKDERFELLYGVDISANQTRDVWVLQELDEDNIPELIIDFSDPRQIIKILNYAKMHQVALVIATTGHDMLEKQLIMDAANVIPIFYSANLSFGILVIKKILMQYAKYLEEDYDIEIIEKHHAKKLDAPSGTALLLGKTIIENTNKEYHFVEGRSGGSGKRKKDEIGIHALRGGSIVGEHQVIFAGLDEVLEFSHQALSKAVFVQGAIKAALFIKGKSSGLYSMDDLI